MPTIVVHPNYLSHTEHFLADSLIAYELHDETRKNTDALTAEVALQANTQKFFLKNTMSLDASWHTGHNLLQGTYPNQSSPVLKR